MNPWGTSYPTAIDNKMHPWGTHYPTVIDNKQGQETSRAPEAQWPLKPDLNHPIVYSISSWCCWLCTINTSACLCGPGWLGWDVFKCTSPLLIQSGLATAFFHCLRVEHVRNGNYEILKDPLAPLEWNSSSEQRRLPCFCIQIKPAQKPGLAPIFLLGRVPVFEKWNLFWEIAFKLCPLLEIPWALWRNR